MKKLILFFIAFLLLATSCKTEKQEVTLGIDLQNSFIGDKVEVSLDGEVVMDGFFTTNDLLGVCLPDGILRMKCLTGKHHIEVRINDTYYKQQKFIVQRDLYYAVRFDQISGNITFIPFDEPFLYD